MRTTVEQVIRTRGLTKSFGSTRALDGVDLTVGRGEVHGFLGPNGSGKSTTIRVLLGLLRKDGGEATLLGGDAWHDAVALHRRLAYVPGDVNLWPNLSGGEAIDLLGELRGSPSRSRRDELVERFQLDPTKKCSAYSKGNRQKVAIVAGLAADVELFLLDEPTSGLDPLMETVFQDVVREITTAGGTVLLSSHILAEAEALCDTVSIIRAGRIVESGSLATLRHLTRTTLHVTTREPLDGLDTTPCCPMCSMTAPSRSASTSKLAVCPASVTTTSWMPGVVSRPSSGSRVVTCRVVRVRCRSVARLPDSTIRPARMIETVSQSASASARMWLDSSTVPPAVVISRTTSWNTVSISGSSPLVGSSSRKSSTSAASPATIATFCRLPLE